MTTPSPGAANLVRVKVGVERLAGSAWARRAALVLALEGLVVGVTLLVEGHGPAPRDATAYALLGVAAGAAGLSGLSPLAALGLTLAAGLAYVARGGSEGGPVVVAVGAALYSAVRPQQLWRTVALGVVTVAALHATRVASTGAAELLGELIHRSGWVAAALILRHAVAYWHGYVAALEDRARLAERTREEHAQRRVAEERLRIARELHDVVSHSISVVNLQAGVAIHIMDERPERAREAMVAIRATTGETLRELRGILGLL